MYLLHTQDFGIFLFLDFECAECQHTFITQNGLNRHSYFHIKNPEKFECNWCSFTCDNDYPIIRSHFLTCHKSSIVYRVNKAETIKKTFEIDNTNHVEIIHFKPKRRWYEMYTQQNQDFNDVNDDCIIID